MRSLLVFIFMMTGTFSALFGATDAAKEAKRYFSEYQSKHHAGEFEEAERKLQAAIALAPDEPLYLYKLAKLRGSTVPPYKPVPAGVE